MKYRIVIVVPPIKTTKMTPEITVRVAKNQDAEPISALCNQLGYSSLPEAVEQRYLQIQANDQHIVYVALVNETIVGWIQGHFCELMITSPQILILGLIVDEQHRGRGIGRRLLQSMEQWAKEKSCDTILVRSNVVRTEAHLFYQKMGYKTIKQSKVFAKSMNEPTMLIHS
jgi:GNAT superfamily N-acetyltransferase